MPREINFKKGGRAKKPPAPSDTLDQQTLDGVAAQSPPATETTNGDAHLGANLPNGLQYDSGTHAVAGTVMIDDGAPPERVPAPDTPQELPKPIQLTSARDLSLVAKAIQDRAATLTKLARDTEGEGYPQEAQRERNDAGTLTQIILPRILGAQINLPIPPEQELPSAIGIALDAAMDGVPVKVRRQVLDILAPNVMAFALELANVAWAAGYAARRDDAAAVSLRAVHKLRGKKPGATA